MTENSTPAPLTALAEAGVSVWLDDLNRPMIRGGELADLVTSRGVVGVTTNPTIFATALKEGEAYGDQVRELAAAGTDVDEAVFAITTTDVREACDVLRPVYDASGGRDGRVSIEVAPGLARDTEGTVAMAKRLWEAVDRPNLFIKIPATVEGLPAISQTLAAGISVNVTLIFSLDRYRGVMNAFLTGLEQARIAGHDLSAIESVASFFVSRVDSEIDKQLEALDASAADLAGRAAVANARLAYQAYEEVFGTPRWENLAADGARAQRPLWASTGVKNPAYPDTLYVTELVVADTVNTMPRATLEAVADHGPVPAPDAVHGTYEQAQAVLDELERVGISYPQVVETLEVEGLSKFDDSWAELVESVRGELEAGSTGAASA